MKPLTKLYAQLLDAKKNARVSDRAAHFYGENLYPAMEGEIKACHNKIALLQRQLADSREREYIRPDVYPDEF